MKKMKKSNKTIQSNVITDPDINLYKIIGQKKTITTLKILVEQYLNDRIEGKNPKYPSILLVGEVGLGRRLIAQAFSNAMGNLEINEALGNSLGMGDDIYEYLQSASEHITLFINSCEYLSQYFQSIIYRIIKENILYVPRHYEKKVEKVPISNHLIILSTVNDKRIIDPLKNAIDICCHLSDYSEDELFQILRQRCQLFGWDYEEDKALRIIANKAQGNPGKAVKVLLMAYRVMRSLGENVIKLSDVNKAVELMGER